MTFMKSGFRSWAGLSFPPVSGADTLARYLPGGGSTTGDRLVEVEHRHSGPGRLSPRSANEAPRSAVNKALMPAFVRRRWLLDRSCLAKCGKTAKCPARHEQSPKSTGPPMTPKPSISFAKHAAPKKGSVVLLSAEGGGLSETAKACDPAKTLERAFAITEFSGKFADFGGGDRAGRLDARPAGRVRRRQDGKPQGI